MAEKPFITCHVLDTVSGKPAAGVAVKLKILKPDHLYTRDISWTAETNSDGRVTEWRVESKSLHGEELNDFVNIVKKRFLKDDEQMVWSLSFDTEAYFGEGKTFWPLVELRFAAKKLEEHYHVPLLLGPWSYTTYRGS